MQDLKLFWSLKYIIDQEMGPLGNNARRFVGELDKLYWSLHMCVDGGGRKYVEWSHSWWCSPTSQMILVGYCYSDGRGRGLQEKLR